MLRFQCFSQCFLFIILILRLKFVRGALEFTCLLFNKTEIRTQVVNSLFFKLHSSDITILLFRMSWLTNAYQCRNEHVDFHYEKGWTEGLKCDWSEASQIADVNWEFVKSWKIQVVAFMWALSGHTYLGIIERCGQRFFGVDGCSVLVLL